MTSESFFFFFFVVVDAFQHCFLGLGFGFGRGKDFLLCLQCHLSEKEGGLFLKEKFLGVVLMSQKRVISLRLFRSTVKKKVLSNCFLRGLYKFPLLQLSLNGPIASSY